MQMSKERILVTHVGSLPRNAVLTDLLLRQESGEAIDAALLKAEIERAVNDVVRKQAQAGVDIGNDGEQQRVGFQTYIPQRMSGFGGESKRRRSPEYEEFPAFAAAVGRRFPRRSKSNNAPQAVGPVQYKDRSQIDREIELFARSTAGAGVSFVEQFMTAPSPGIIATTMHNAFYESHEAYVNALAREMRTEYSAVHEAGLLLQIDAPDLAMERTMFAQDMSDREYVALCEVHVAALNKALEGIPASRVRLHCCWGNWEGPHIHDIPLATVLPVLLQARVGALSIEFANPRHQHEYDALRKLPLPDEMVLLPGVIDTTTNIVEHPEVVARRLEQAVAIIGDRERVTASTDCGFGTFAGYEWVAEDVVWAKLKTARRGAEIASARLWGVSDQRRAANI
jgi:5-methyltetrahydropteroyltriglutamate--homocysteine methyltransferase